MELYFVKRLYGLSILNFFKYSFFFFYFIQIRKTMYSKLIKSNIKVSYLYNYSFKKINRSFITYTNLKLNSFNISNIINVFNTFNIKCYSLSYNNYYYNYNYYNNNLICKYNNFITFLLYKQKTFYTFYNVIVLYNIISILKVNIININRYHYQYVKKHSYYI